VTETSALNSIQPPPITYKIKIPKSTIERGLLTNLQLEAILYACDQHQRMLPCDKSKGETPLRAGFFMGDGPGVGKGRQIAGIVMENYLRGRKKAVWISVGADLLEDARRDLRDIGAGAITVHDLRHWSASKKLASVSACDTGVVFSTYALLARSAKQKATGENMDGIEMDEKSRVRQIVEWCGPEFDGVIALDEAHKAKNMTMKSAPKGKGGKVKGKDKSTGFTGADVDPELDTVMEDAEPSEGATLHGTNSAQVLVFVKPVFCKHAWMTMCASASCAVVCVYARIDVFAIEYTNNHTTTLTLSYISIYILTRTYAPTHTHLQAVLQLQKLLPNARVVYVSATGASEPEHLLYASRLGLWGSGTSFAGPIEFAKEITEGGPSAMELLAMQMKQSGKYLARSLSFKGATFEVVDVPLTKQFEETYDASVQLWTDLHHSLYAAMMKNPNGIDGKATISDGAEGKASKGRVMRTMRVLWGNHQRFFGQMLMAAKVDKTVIMAQQAVDAGKCVVIGLQSTGESGLKDDAGESGCSAADHILRSSIQKLGSLYLEKPKVKGLLQRLDELKLPLNPLDDLIDRLGGPRRVAEMTGRSVRQVCERGEWVLEKRLGSKDCEDTINIQERKNFMSGKKLVAIISGPNISSHVHVILQISGARRATLSVCSPPLETDECHLRIRCCLYGHIAAGGSASAE